MPYAMKSDTNTMPSVTDTDIDTDIVVVLKAISAKHTT